MQGCRSGFHSRCVDRAEGTQACGTGVGLEVEDDGGGGMALGEPP